MTDCKIDVMGTEYAFCIRTEAEDRRLTQAGGYCDETKKLIVVERLTARPCELEIPEVFMRRAARHEIIHAFLYESGIGEDAENIPQGQSELYVDWFARQYPRLRSAFEQAGCSENRR